MEVWIDRDLVDVNITVPCKLCSTECISVGNGYCLDCYLARLKDVLINDYPVSGPEVIDTLKKKGMNI